MGDNNWQFWVDRGGTFTDIVARRPDGTLTTRKLLSENPQQAENSPQAKNPEQYEDATIQGIADLLAAENIARLPAGSVIKMGTTVATNALLERKGEPLLLLTNAGFADLPQIGDQTRPQSQLFALDIRRPSPLYSRVAAVGGRLAADGGIVTPLDESATRTALQSAYDGGIRAVAIAFLHSCENPAHEQQAAEIARAVGFSQISAGHDASPLVKILPRMDTAMVDAYLTPVLRRYVERVKKAMDDKGGARLLLMRSDGGLTGAHLFRGKDAILSGPAGGVVGMAQTAAAAGFRKVIGFDMGGTSTDVSHYAGEYERVVESEINGVRIRSPMLHIHTIAAGGGSLLRYEDGRYQVGPQSAGANPGPACYRRGGELTVTDCNVMLGRVQPKYFPPLFGKNGDMPPDDKIVREKFLTLAADIKAQTARRSVATPPQSPEETAAGFLRVAVENMANAVKKISVRRGYDITEYALNCFGGAGGQHVCMVADALSLRRALIHPLAGLLSAYGMGLAEIRALRERQIDRPLTDDAAGTTPDELAAEAKAELLAQQVGEKETSVVHRARLRYAGADQPLTVDFADADSMRRQFHQAHLERYGFAEEGGGIILDALEAEAVAKTPPPPATSPPAFAAPPTPAEFVSAYFDGRRQQTPLFIRADLQLGQTLDGAAIIAENAGTIVVEPGWRATVGGGNNLLLTRVEEKRKEKLTNVAEGETTVTADPVMLEIFNNRFMSIAEQMGWTLANTAYSVNIKERLDFSCALFDAQGNLIANAPHVPVHLGSMGESVRAVIRQNSDMRPGDSFMLNSPFNGGTHLPDVTVVSPVFDGGEEPLHGVTPLPGIMPLFFVGARGHHADIGGSTPGSMPPDSTHIDEEGVVIDNYKIVCGGKFREEEIRSLLSSAVHPCRNIQQNIADIKAQIAANKTGAREIEKMLGHFGLETVRAYMAHVRANAEESVRRAIGNLHDGACVYPLDDGAQISVAVRVDRAAGCAEIDFAGTSAQHPGNYNVPPAVTRAAVLYVFRVLAGADIPLNEGCLAPLRILIPQNSMLSPSPPAAVIAGNTEVSQAIVDCLFSALGVVAGSQGTMNNFVWGDEETQNYETLGGGTGAGDGFAGAAAVHSHMTNTRMTDAEVLERRFPVRLEEISIRRGSGGEGKYKGGDGMLRRLRFLRPMLITLITSHRLTPPRGMAGGGDGACGENSVQTADGKTIKLKGNAKYEVKKDDIVTIKTPGGGAAA